MDSKMTDEGPVSPRKWVSKKKAGTEVWFGIGAEDLPYKKLGLLEPELFVSYSGPDSGLVLVHELEKKLENQTSPKYIKGRGSQVAGAQRWNLKNRKCYGICMSLYDQHPINAKISGDPVADSFAICARRNNACLIVADGVNWGEKSKMAARCAVYGAMRHVNMQLYAAESKRVKTTQEVFTLLLAAMTEAHKTILRHEGGLTTLCVALVLPTRSPKQYVVCIANVGDSLAYVYSKFHGIREITTGSHDIQSERDIRDAGGALGPVHGTEPELHNLTCSMTYVDPGDIVYLTTDGISDNFDPVVTKIAVAKRQPRPKVHDDEDPIVAPTATEEEETPPPSNTNHNTDNMSSPQQQHNGREDDNVEIKTNQNNCETSENNTMEGGDAQNNPADLTRQTSDTSQNNASDNSSQNKHGISQVVDNLNNVDVNSDSNQGVTSPGNNSVSRNNQINANQVRSPSRKPNVVSPKSQNRKSSQTPSSISSPSNNSKRNTCPAKINSSIIKNAAKSPESPEKKVKTLSFAGDRKSEGSMCGTQGGKPEMEPHERHRYAVREMERVLLEFELFTEEMCCAQELCGGLLQHVLKLTDPKRKVLEDPNLYGRRLKKRDKERRDSQICAQMSAAPGKLDHATIVAYEVGRFRGDEDEDYEKSDPENDTLGSDIGSSMSDVGGVTPMVTRHCIQPPSVDMATSPIHNPSMDIPFIDDSDQSDC